MKRLFVLVGVAWTAAPLAASADIPAWCGTASFEADGSDLHELERSEPEYVVRALAKTRCSTSPEVAQQHANIDAARQAWAP